jgi:hypothetical protein
MSPHSGQKVNDVPRRGGKRNIQCNENQMHGRIAAAREVCNATGRLGDGSQLIVHQRVRGSIRAIMAITNTRVFLTETWFVADDTPALLQTCYITQAQSILVATVLSSDLSFLLLNFLKALI